MNRTLGLFLFFASLVGAIAATHAMVSEAPPVGRTCAQDHMVSFGWTDKRKSVAELAAIAKWQNQTEEKLPGFGQWHQAHKRAVKCRVYRDSSHFQCQVSARPCQYDGPDKS